MRVLPDTSTQVSALRNREVDTFKEIGAVSGVNAVQVVGGTFNNLVLYANKPPFHDPKVRLALKLAMDRAPMTAAITGDTGTPANDQPISAAYEYVDRSAGVRKQDLVEARRLLKDAGHGNGFEHKVVVSNSPASREKTAVVIQAMAQQIGIQFNLELMDNARYGSTVWNKGIDSYIGNYTTRPTEDAILSKLYSKAYGIDEGRWATAETEKMLETGRATTDPAKRREIYIAFERLAPDQGPFIIPISLTRWAHRGAT
jgi:peptide/nickel transport system substrate-binding protein